MFIPLKMVLIGIDPYPYGSWLHCQLQVWASHKYPFCQGLLLWLKIAAQAMVIFDMGKTKHHVWDLDGGTPIAGRFIR